MNDLRDWKERHKAASRHTVQATVDEFERVLNDAPDERPLQTFLASHSNLLSGLAPPGNGYWCLDRPRLGAEFIPDFLLASETSEGMHWRMVELESPNERVLTRAGLPAKKLAEAQKQIRDWRTWLADNVSYARNELALQDITSTCHAFVIIGRRHALDPKQAKVYRAISTADMTVMSYDRLLDTMLRIRIEKAN